MRTPIQPLTLLMVAVAGWLQRDQQAAIVYLLEENRILKARLFGRKLRLTDDERRRLAVKGKALGRKPFWLGTEGSSRRSGTTARGGNSSDGLGSWPKLASLLWGWRSRIRGGGIHAFAVPSRISAIR